MYPLARRLCNRKAEDSSQLRLYGPVMDCVAKEPSNWETIPFAITYCAIKAWRQARQGREAL